MKSLTHWHRQDERSKKFIFQNQTPGQTPDPEKTTPLPSAEETEEDLARKRAEEVVRQSGAEGEEEMARQDRIDRYSDVKNIKEAARYYGSPHGARKGIETSADTNKVIKELRAVMDNLTESNPQIRMTSHPNSSSYGDLARLYGGYYNMYLKLRAKEKAGK